ncbi:MAG: hypothetical protein ACI9VO_001415 [Colwellia sp.]|jgi:hypothetical protein
MIRSGFLKRASSSGAGIYCYSQASETKLVNNKVSDLLGSFNTGDFTCVVLPW